MVVYARVTDVSEACQQVIKVITMALLANTDSCNQRHRRLNSNSNQVKADRFIS